jgi:ribonuclease T1
MIRGIATRLIVTLLLGLLTWSSAQAFWGTSSWVNLKTVQLVGLPIEVRQTLTLIKQGGPFPYERDGIVFQNRENRLPPKPRGYYHEYTVPTPGARNRGARRIVAGQPGEYYYTQDHYLTLWRIRE